MDKIRAREKFQATGIASLKVRVPATKYGTQLLSLEISLDESAKILGNLIAEKLKIEKQIVRVIAAGRVLDEVRSLKEQNVSNNQQLMALISTEDTSDNSTYDRAARIKRDAEQLVNDKKSSYMEMQDQDGNPIYLPENERKSLMLGLALYEKGRTLLKDDNHSEALLLFLEADQAFSTCQSKLLESVDNYLLLNLDVVWCYLCLKSVTQLPDAERRLKICEDGFQKIYGPNLDRVVQLKKNEGNEKALIMRLHLLQAILYYHMNRRNEAQGMLALAESELQRLKVDDVSLTTLVEMGYDAQEARIALRATGNEINEAISEILERRQKIDEARKSAKENQKLLGKHFVLGTVNPNSVKSLMEMGFDKNLAAMALEETNGTIEDAIQLLQKKAEELKRKFMKRIKTDVTENLLESVSFSYFKGFVLLLTCYVFFKIANCIWFSPWFIETSTRSKRQ